VQSVNLIKSEYYETIILNQEFVTYLAKAKLGQTNEKSLTN